MKILKFLAPRSAAPLSRTIKDFGIFHGKNMLESYFVLKSFAFNNRTLENSILQVCASYLFEFQSYLTGHHIYKNVFKPTLAEKSATTTES